VMFDRIIKRDFRILSVITRRLNAAFGEHDRREVERDAEFLEKPIGRRATARTEPAARGFGMSRRLESGIRRLR